MKKLFSFLTVILLFITTCSAVSLKPDVIYIEEIEEEYVTKGNGGLMNSSWPMKCHDTRHTGRSPYNAADNPGVEKWRFRTAFNIEEGIVIDENGTLYVGDTNLYAVYPNGTLKWLFKLDGYCTSVPALASDGTIYIGTFYGKFYAVNPNGTKKWKFTPSGSGISIRWSSPAIANDGTIYFGTMSASGGCKLYALNPDGTEKWYYKTGSLIDSSPAIGEDGTIYVGSDNGNLYAVWPNGTLKWKYHTGGWVKSPPSISDDGTVYFSSYDGYLYALYPNGTLKWRFNNSGSGKEAATIGTDGMIYIVGKKKLFAINPVDGSLKWSYDFEEGTSPCSPAIDSEGIIYVSKGKIFYAFNPEGTLRWKYKVPFPNGKGELSTSPCIGSDGTVYTGSAVHEYIEPGGLEVGGYIHAFGSGNEKKANMTRPKEGYLYLFNDERGETWWSNTLVIGDLDVKATVTQPEKVEEVLFRLKYRCGYVPGKEWVIYVDREPPFDCEWRLNASEPVYIPYGLNVLFDLEVRAYYKGGFEYHDTRGGCVWSEEITIIYIHPW